MSQEETLSPSGGEGRVRGSGPSPAPSIVGRQDFFLARLAGWPLATAAPLPLACQRATSSQVVNHTPRKRRMKATRSARSAIREARPLTKGWQVRTKQPFSACIAANSLLHICSTRPGSAMALVEPYTWRKRGASSISHCTGTSTSGPLLLRGVEEAHGLVDIAVGPDLVSRVADPLGGSEMVLDRPAGNEEAGAELEPVEEGQDTIDAHPGPEATLLEVAQAPLGLLRLAEEKPRLRVEVEGQHHRGLLAVRPPISHAVLLDEGERRILPGGWPPHPDTQPPLGWRICPV